MPEPSKAYLESVARRIINLERTAHKVPEVFKDFEDILRQKEAQYVAWITELTRRVDQVPDSKRLEQLTQNLLDALKVTNDTLLQNRNQKAREDRVQKRSRPIGSKTPKTRSTRLTPNRTAKVTNIPETSRCLRSAIVPRIVPLHNTRNGGRRHI